MKAVNDRWMSHLSGPLDMSHIAIGCALGYLDFRHDARGWRKGNDALDDWYAVVLRNRDSMKATDASRTDARQGIIRTPCSRCVCRSQKPQNNGAGLPIKTAPKTRKCPFASGR